MRSQNTNGIGRRRERPSRHCYSCVALIVVLGLSACQPTNRAAGQLEDLPYGYAANEREVASLEAHLVAHSGDTDARFRLVDIYLEEFFFRRAVSELNGILTLNPQSLAAHEMLAFTLMKMPERDDRRALQVLNNAVEIAPQDPSVHANLAVYYAEIGELTSAESEARRVLGNRPDDRNRVVAYLILAAISEQRGDAGGAKRYFDKASAIDPTIRSDGGVIAVPVYVGDHGLFGELSLHPTPGARAMQADMKISRFPKR